MRPGVVLRRAGAAALALACTTAVAAAQHPLDALSEAEIRSTVATLRREARFVDAAFPILALAEPEKAEVLRWTRGSRFPRHARAVIATRAGVVEATVDLERRRLLTTVERPGVEVP